MVLNVLKTGDADAVIAYSDDNIDRKIMLEILGIQTGPNVNREDTAVDCEQLKQTEEMHNTVTEMEKPTRRPFKRNKGEE